MGRTYSQQAHRQLIMTRGVGCFLAGTVEGPWARGRYLRPLNAPPRVTGKRSLTALSHPACNHHGRCGATLRWR